MSDVFFSVQAEIFVEWRGEDRVLNEIPLRLLPSLYHHRMNSHCMNVEQSLHFIPVFNRESRATDLYFHYISSGFEKEKKGNGGLICTQHMESSIVLGDNSYIISFNLTPTLRCRCCHCHPLMRKQRNSKVKTSSPRLLS